MQLNRQFVSRLAAEQGGHPAQTGCLMAIMGHEGLTQSQLAEKQRITPATLTPMLQRMEKAGLVERYADADDQRVTRVRLTKPGMKAAHDHAHAHAEYLNAAMGSLTPGDRREFTRLLTLIGDNVEKELSR